MVSSRYVLISVVLSVVSAIWMSQSHSSASSSKWNSPAEIYLVSGHQVRFLYEPSRTPVFSRKAGFRKFVDEERRLSFRCVGEFDGSKH
jgi:hypothetical protein